MRTRRAADVAFGVLFSLYTAGVVVWLAVGLVPVAARHLPSLAPVLGDRVATASSAADSLTRVGLETALSLLNLALGLIVVRRRPRDLSARLIAVGMIGTAATFNHQSHSVLRFDLLGDQADLHTLFHLASGLAYVTAVVVFPDGRFVPFTGPARARAAVAGAYALALGLVALAVLTAIPESHPGQRFFTLLFGVLVPVSGLAAQYYRRRRTSDPELVQQSRLLQWALVPMLVGGLLYAASGPGGPEEVGDLGLAVFPALFALIPIALVVGILRYRLWDIDVLLTRTLISVGLAGLIGASYVVMVVVLGEIIGSRAPVGGLEILATAVAALAFEPARERLQRLASRIVYGERATPYEAMAGFGATLAGAISVEDVLPEMAERAAGALSGAWSEVSVRLPGGGSRSVTWPAGRRPPGGETVTAPIRSRGLDIGEVTVGARAGDRPGPEDRRLLETLATQAGLAVDNARLALELSDRLGQLSSRAAELRASQARILTAREALRQRVLAVIAERVETRLASVRGTVDRMDGALTAGPDQVTVLLDSARGEAALALEALRDLARGLFPAILSDRGVVAALHAHLDKTGQAADVREGGIDGRRFDGDVEATVFFGITECLARGARAWAGPVTVEVAAGAGRVSFCVSGRPSRRRRSRRVAGNGAAAAAVGADDLRDVADRIEAVGGEFAAAETGPDGRLELSGWVPDAREPGPAAGSVEAGEGGPAPRVPVGAGGVPSTPGGRDW